MKIIALEGIDGSGKTVQFNMLHSKLLSLGYKVDCLDFPAYDSLFGKHIGELLSGKGKIDANLLDPMSMALWYAADRVAVFNKKYPYGIKNAGSDYLLLNRYVLSNAVYQSIRVSETEADKMIDWVFEMEHEELLLPKPDIYVFLNVSENSADSNVLNKGYREYIGNDKDVYERKENIQADSKSAYLKCANRYDNIKVVECMSDNKMLSPDVINGLIMNELKQNNII